SQEWIYLFDGTSTEGWRGYNMDSLPPGWIVKDSTLTFDTELGLEQDYTGGKDIIYAKEEFDNFELYLEWKIPAGGNSGIFYHVKEGYDGPPVVSPEYQLIDDERSEEHTSELQSRENLVCRLLLEKKKIHTKVDHVV